MKLYMAPLEDVTGYVYRNAYHACFSPMDKYFAPFIAAKQNLGKLFSYKERNDILPEHNKNLYVVPQILTNSSEDFIRTAKGLQEFGYQEVNLNLGCPSKPVVNGGRGSGFLWYRDKLNQFLEEIFDGVDAKISIKTRVGRYEPEEISALMEIYNKYPVEELIVHPRVQTDLYRGKPRLDAFSVAYEQAKQPLCYNGDLFRLDDFVNLIKEFPEIDGVMLGRGMLTDPELPGNIRKFLSGKIEEKDEEDKWEQWERFLTMLVEDFRRVSVNDEKALFKMKELWCYFRYAFPKCDIWERKIKRAQTIEEYLSAIQELQEEYPGQPGGYFSGREFAWGRR